MAKQKTEKKELFIVKFDITSILILMVLAFGMMSTFNSNRENLELGLLFLGVATVMYFIASSVSRRRGKEDGGFSRALNSFVSGLVFLVAPCIFFYHWQYNGNFESGIMVLFIVTGILRISFFNHHSSKADANKYYYTGMPVFWSPVLVAMFYALSFMIGTDMVNGLLSVTLIVFSFMMILNKDFKYLHKPKSWGTQKKK